MDHEIEFRHLRYFIVVAEELHFGRAARKLHLSQPPLSQQIRKLEELLGTALFTRTSRSVRLTEAGEMFLDRARRVLSNLGRDFEETRAIGLGEVGSLHIGFVGSAMLTMLPAIFRVYRQRYPRVQLHLHELFTSRVAEELKSGALDAGILRDADEDESLTFTTLLSEFYVAVLPGAHARARQKSLSPASLRDESFIYYPRAAGVRAFEKPLTVFEEYGFRPRIVQEASHWLTILRLVGAGLGVSVAPACVRHIASPEVACLPLRGTKVASQVQLARRSGDTRPVVEHFAEIAAASGTEGNRKSEF